MTLALNTSGHPSFGAPAESYVMGAQNEARRIPGLPSDQTLRPINRVGVVGAGTMGGGIAMNFLNAGIPTVLIDTTAEALNRGVGIIQRNYDATAAKGKISPQDVAQRMSLLSPTVDDAALRDCDLVIEAVYENLEVKLAVCRRLGDVCRPGAIIASNTSTLNLDQLAQATGRAADVLGMHFFSPANVMRLLEVVRGQATAPDVLATVMHLADRIGKVAVVSGVCYGFIGNRMLESYLREADALILAGATPAQVDRAIESLGLAMGPCRMLDMAGTDVAAKIVQERAASGTVSQDARYRAMVSALHARGRHGQKSGSGYYRYDGRTPVDDPEVTALAETLAHEHGVARRDDITDDEIIERCLYPLINEGAAILQEGIAYRAGDVDVVWVNGYGFPKSKGGPLYWADAIGAQRIVERLQHYGQAAHADPDDWAVNPLLADLARRGARFQDHAHDHHTTYSSGARTS